MKRVEQIINMARMLSGNTRHNSTSGIPQEVFVQFANNAQDSLLKQVVNLKTKFMKKSTEVAVVSGQVAYNYPVDCYIRHVEAIQWKAHPSAQPTNLVECYTVEQLSNLPGHAYGYILKNDGIYLNPPLNSGTLVITHEKQPNRLQIKCGEITVLSVAGSTVSSITVATSGPYDVTMIDDDYFLCIVDKYGNQKAKNIEYTGESGGVFTIPSHVLASDESIAVGDYVTVGRNTTNLPEWPEVCESYLIKHMVYDAKYMDASTWAQEAKDDMRTSFDSLAGSFASMSENAIEIPITNTDYL